MAHWSQHNSRFGQSAHKNWRQKIQKQYRNPNRYGTNHLKYAILRMESNLVINTTRIPTICEDEVEEKTRKWCPTVYLPSSVLQWKENVSSFQMLPKISMMANLEEYFECHELFSRSSLLHNETQARRSSTAVLPSALRHAITLRMIASGSYFDQMMIWGVDRSVTFNFLYIFML